MSFVAKLKRDCAKHPAKAAVLGLLAVVMAVMSVKMVVELRGAQATMPIVGAAAPADVQRDSGAGRAETDKRFAENKDLWQTLHEVRGLNAGAAFSFDSAFYQPDPNSRKIVPQPEPGVRTSEPILIPQAQPDPETSRATIERRVREGASALVIRSTSVGTGTEPVAIINQQLVRLGDKVLGYEITAIRSREVEFKKEGVTIAVPMPDPRGP